MKKVKGLAMAALMLTAGATAANAQDNVEATASADFVSNYIWRGQECGNVSIQPTLGLSYKGLALTAWGSVGIESSDTKELDLTLGYSAGGFNIGITDYWFSSGQDAKGRYFMYEAHKTNHVFEANIGYDFGPVALQWYTNFAGNDYKTETNDVNGVPTAEQKHAYSSYVELSAPFKLGGLDWTAALGAVPYKSSGTYGNVEDFAITNVSVKATKDIAITPSFSVPLFAQVMANPNTQKAYFAVGFTLHP